MENLVNKIREHLYLYAKERYLWEHTRKNELNHSMTIPLGILIIQITSFSYFLSLNFPKEIHSGMFTAFIISLLLSIISITLSICLFVKHQSGYKYEYIHSHKNMKNYYDKNIKAYNDNIDYDYIYKELKETEFLTYIEATEKNIFNNETKTEFYRYFLLSLVISTFLLVLALFFSFFIDRNIESIKMIIENLFIK